jgi:hypothetical protein
METILDLIYKGLNVKKENVGALNKFDRFLNSFINKTSKIKKLNIKINLIKNENKHSLAVLIHNKIILTERIKTLQRTFGMSEDIDVDKIKRLKLKIQYLNMILEKISTEKDDLISNISTLPKQNIVESFLKKEVDYLKEIVFDNVFSSFKLHKQECLDFFEKVNDSNSIEVTPQLTVATVDATTTPNATNDATTTPNATVDATTTPSAILDDTTTPNVIVDATTTPNAIVDTTTSNDTFDPSLSECIEEYKFYLNSIESKYEEVGSSLNDLIVTFNEECEKYKEFYSEANTFLDKVKNYNNTVKVSIGHQSLLTNLNVLNFKNNFNLFNDFKKNLSDIIETETEYDIEINKVSLIIKELKFLINKHNIKKLHDQLIWIDDYLIILNDKAREIRNLIIVNDKQ